MSQTDAKGRTTRFEYDADGRLVQTVLTGGMAESWQYDGRGNLVRRVDFAGQATGYAYDTDDHLVRVTFADGNERRYTYDALGRRTTAEANGRVTRFTYDAAGLLESVENPGGRTSTYTYNAAGQRTLTTLLAGDDVWSTSYTYDVLGRLISVVDPAGGVYEFDYDAAWRRTALRFPNGVSQDYEWDVRGRLTGLTTRRDTEILHGETYNFNASGGLLAVTEQSSAASEYAYDPAHQLLTARHTDADGEVSDWTFTYDEVGNRLSFPAAGGSGLVEAATYDARDRLLSKGSFTYTWDNGGRLLSRDGDQPLTLAWQGGDRLGSIDLGDERTVDYEYDADGRHVRSVRTDGASGSQAWEAVHDLGAGLSQVQAAFGPSGLIDYYVMAGSERLAVLRPDGTRYYVNDRLGSVRALVDEDGMLTDQYRYSPLGELLEHGGSDANPFLFAGQWRDPWTGFDNLRARWLDPSAGRFLSMDPFKGFASDPRSQHRYQYAHNDSISLADPSGEFTTASALVVGLGATMLASIGVLFWQGSFNTVKVDVDPIIINDTTWAGFSDAFFSVQFWMAEQIYGHQGTNVHLIFNKTQNRRSKWGGSIIYNNLVQFLGENHRKNTVPLVYLEEVFDVQNQPQGGLAVPGNAWHSQENVTWCLEPSYVRGAAIAAWTSVQPKVTAHELGHVIGCLPDRGQANPTPGEEWMLMWNSHKGFVDLYGPGVTLETWEVNMLRKWGRRIP